MTKVALSVIVLSVCMHAVLSNPVGNSTSTGLAENGSSLLNGVIGDLKMFLKGMVGELRAAIKTFPANYTNSEITTKDINGTMVQTNTTIVKRTEDSHIKFHYSLKNKILNSENSTSVTTN